MGIVRSPEGNCHHISNRISAHKKAIFGILHSGLAHHHKGNPYASLKVEKCFGEPVLLSGLSSLILTKKEENCLSQHYKSYLERILRIFPSSPSSFVYFVAILHLNILRFDTKSDFSIGLLEPVCSSENI